MQLPAPIREAIDQRCDELGLAVLQRACRDISDAYREGRPAAISRMPAAERVAAYLATRMPATYAAARAVLGEVAPRLNAPVTSVLDIGAGSGAAGVAALELFPHAALTMIERDAALAASAREWLPGAELRVADIRRIDSFPPHDLVIAAYSLGELDPRLAAPLWNAARVALVIIEPGTPRGFALVRDVRSALLAAGARMVAPCPAETPCPVQSPDWCHFAARVERSAMHRRAKAAELGHEDEKFSYVAVARDAVDLPAARIVRHPRQRPGLIEIETCTPAGLRSERVTRRDPALFRAARRAHWGEHWTGSVSSHTVVLRSFSSNFAPLRERASAPSAARIPGRPSRRDTHGSPPQVSSQRVLRVSASLR